MIDKMRDHHEKKGAARGQYRGLQPGDIGQAVVEEKILQRGLKDPQKEKLQIFTGPYSPFKDPDLCRNEKEDHRGAKESESRNQYPPGDTRLNAELLKGNLQRGEGTPPKQSASDGDQGG